MNRYRILSYHAQLSLNPHNWAAMIGGLLIMAKDNWVAHAAGHMGVLDTYTNTVYEAEAKGLVKRDLTSDIEDYDGAIYSFSFNPPLTNDAEARIGSWLEAHVGAPYNYLLLAEDAIITVARFLSYVAANPLVNFISHANPVDPQAGHAFVCYQVDANAINEAHRPGMRVDPTTFGPLDVWKFVDQGLMVFDGQLTLSQPPVEAPPE